MVPARVRFVLLRVTPPIELLAAALPMKLLEVCVALLLMLPPLMSKVEGTMLFRITDATILLVTERGVPLKVRFDCACAMLEDVPVAVST